MDPDQTARSLFWVHPVFSNVRQLFAADDFSRHFQMHFFLCALRVNSITAYSKCSFGEVYCLINLPSDILPQMNILNNMVIPILLPSAFVCH